MDSPLRRAEATSKVLSAVQYRPLFRIFGFSLPVLTRRKFRSTMQEVPAKVKVGISCFSVSDII